MSHQEPLDIASLPVEVGQDRGGDAAERLEPDPASRHTPGGDGPAAHQGEGPEDAVHGHDRLVAAQDRLAVAPAMQQRVEPAEQPGSASTVRGGATGQVDLATWPFLQFCADRAQPTTGVANGDAGPLGQVAIIGRAVAGEESSGQLGKGGIAVGHHGRVTQPVADEDERLVTADDGPADRKAPEGRQKQDVDHRLSGDRHIGRAHEQAQLGAGHRPVRCDRRLDHGNPSIGLRWRNPFLCKASGVAGGQLRRREPL